MVSSQVVTDSLILLAEDTLAKASKTFMGLSRWKKLQDRPSTYHAYKQKTDIFSGSTSYFLV